MSDIQEEWETYKGFRIVSILNQMASDPETEGKWIASVEIRSAIDGEPVMPLITIDGYFASKEEARRAAVKLGKLEIDNVSADSP